MNENGSGWSKVALVFAITFCVLVFGYFAGVVLENLFGEVGQILGVILFGVVIAVIGVSAIQASGVLFYRAGMRDGSQATINGLDAGVQVTESNDRFDIEKMKVAKALQTGQNYGIKTEQKLIEEAEKARIALQRKAQEAMLLLDKNDAVNTQRVQYQSQIRAQRQAEKEMLERQQQAELDEFYEVWDEDDSELTDEFWNGEQE